MFSLALIQFWKNLVSVQYPKIVIVIIPYHGVCMGFKEKRAMNLTTYFTGIM